MYLVVYGPEGSGKGTQAKLLSQKLQLPLYTTGDLVRERAQNDKGHMGDKCREALLTGKYLTDQEICQLIEDKLNNNKASSGFVLDGFPRNLNQAQFLQRVLNKAKISLDRVIYLRLDDEDAYKRLILRKRPLFANSNILHDSPDRIRSRLKVFREKEKELLPYFQKMNLLLNINANGSVEEVFNDILEGLHDKT